jgi:hypothetical protein
VARTTPDRSVDLTALFPELTRYARTATRLHPRTGSPTARCSSVGGPLLWPADEPWPTCPGPHHVRPGDCMTVTEVRRQRAILATATDRAIRDRATHLTLTTEEREALSEFDPTRGPLPQPTPLIPLAQLYARDIPDLQARPGADVLQALWCPFDHDSTENEGPAVTLRWRDSSSVGALLTDPPQPAALAYADYLPEPCVLHPEQITEYPRAVQLFEELDPDLCERIAAWSRQADGISPEHSEAELPWEDAGRYDEISATHTWKVGGWPFWSFRDPWPIQCEACATDMIPLLQVGSGEWFSDVGYWTPTEDVAEIRVMSLPPQTFGNPPHICLAHGYRLQIYVCPATADHRHRQLLM